MKKVQRLDNFINYHPKQNLRLTKKSALNALELRRYSDIYHKALQGNVYLKLTAARKLKLNSAMDAGKV